MNTPKHNPLYQKGQTMIILVIFFLAFSLTAVYGIMNPVIRHAKAITNIIESKQGYYLAESGIEDVVYRLKNALSAPSSVTIALNGGSVTTVTSDNIGGKNIASEGNSKDFIRRVETNLATGVGVSFNYGVQTGTGGFSLSNNSGVVGNIYSNGPISGSSGSYITGSAYSANSASLSVVEENISPSTPPNQIIFGNANATQDFAQSFAVATSGPIGKIALHIKKVSTPSNITVRIVADNAGSPSNTVLSSATISASLITTTYGWVEVPLQASSDLSPNTTYWIVLDASTNSSRYYTLAANTTYATGTPKIGQYPSTWNNTSPSGLDGYFKIYLGGTTGSISGVDVGTIGTGVAHAHTVDNVDVSGALYCQTGSGNNKACNTTQQDPSPLPLPVSDANINQWKNEAETGTVINGDHTITGQSVNLGPVKIVGNLTVSNNSTVTITGTVWVTGNITLSNNVTTRLASGYGASSGAIISDGRISASNNASFAGSGTTGSYVMLLTTSDCPNNATCGGNPAMSIGNNAGAVILNAQKGTITFSNNSGAKEATANLISLSNNAVINYESGLANVNFSSGPSGGFDILNWKEIE